MMGSLTKPLLVGAVVAVIVAVFGAVLTDTGPWYRALKFPAWKPPDWAFGPVWTSIFILCVVAGALAWRDGTDGQRQLIVVLFAVNAVLNILWSALFFWMRRPELALYEVPLLWLSILALIVALWPIHRGASCMLLPYLVWVSTASMLNLSIVRLNGL
jgi:translocator protein